VAKADMPDFTVAEATEIANQVVGRYDALESTVTEFPDMPAKDMERLKREVKQMKPLADKLRPWFTGASS